MTNLSENLTKAHQTADLLLSDLREVHKAASGDEALTILMEEAMQQTAQMRIRLERLAKHYGSL